MVCLTFQEPTRSLLSIRGLGKGGTPGLQTCRTKHAGGDAVSCGHTSGVSQGSHCHPAKPIGRRGRRGRGRRCWVPRTVPVAMKTQYYSQQRLGGASKALHSSPFNILDPPPPLERGSGTFGARRPRREGLAHEQQLSRSGRSRPSRCRCRSLLEELERRLTF